MRLVLVTAKNCAPCEELEEAVREYVESGDIEKLDVAEDNDAAELFNKGKVTLPGLALLTPDNEVFAQVKLPPDSPCSKVKPMAKWIEGGDSSECRPCLLGPTVQWYQSELEEKGYPRLAVELTNLVEREEVDPLTLCEKLDKIKATVGRPVRERLLEFDCATQLQESTLEDEPSDDSTAE